MVPARDLGDRKGRGVKVKVGKSMVDILLSQCLQSFAITREIIGFPLHVIWLRREGILLTSQNAR